VQVAAAGGLAILAIVAVIASGASGPLPAGIVAAAWIAAIGAYLVLWRESIVRVHRMLLANDRLGDLTRLLLFLTGLLAFPLATIAVPFLLFNLLG
jgi:hypothetical protein